MDYLKVASEYVRNGYNLVPLQLDGSKQPVGKWRHLQDRAVSRHECQEWFSDGRCGIGVITGGISGNLHVIDFDIDAEQHLDRFKSDVLQRAPGIWEKLAVVRTPRPGYQVWFRQESVPPKSRRLALSEPRATGDFDEDGNPVCLPQVLIETRGSGAYVCAVGSPAETHRNREQYRLIHGSLDSLPKLADAEAATLLEICCGYNRYTPKHVGPMPGEPYAGMPRPGDIFNRHADLRQLLLDAGWTIHHSDEDVDYLTRPGKRVDDGYSATLGYVRSDEGRPLLMVFTSAAPPFENDCCYDAFACYSLLQHGGNFSRAAAAARVLYEGQLSTAQRSYCASTSAPSPAADTYKPLPVNLFPEVVQAYISEHADAIGIDRAYVAVPMLSVLAGLIGKSRGLFLKRSWMLPSIIWTVTVGDVSSGKTPGWEAAIAPAERIEASLHAAMTQRDAEYQRLVKAYEQAKASGDRSAAKPIKEKHSEQLTINDATMEVLVEIHRHNAKLILACDELAAWLRGMDQYRGGKGRDVENWLSIYNGGSMQVNRKLEDYRVYLPTTSISVCGTIQPGVAAETLYTNRFIENGFASRILSAQPPSKVVRWSDREVTEEVDDAMFRLARQLYALPLEPHGSGHRTFQLSCSENALKEFITWTNDAADHAEAMEGALKASWLKLRPTAGRFALVFAIIRQLQHCPDGQATQPVDLESMRAGIQLAMWFGHELERNCHVSVKADIQKHLEWILSHHPSGVDARTLLTGRRSIKSADAARDVLRNLSESGYGKLQGSLFVPHSNEAL